MPNPLAESASRIRYRNVRSADVGDGIRVYACDFSITHGLGKIAVLNRLVNGPGSLARRVVNQLTENAVIIADLPANTEYRSGP